MSKYAVMPLSDYVAACDKIRGHLKTTDKITSDSLPVKIDEVFQQGGNEAYGPAYEKGYYEGQELGFTSGVRQGKDDYIAELLPYNQNLQLAIQGYVAGRTDKEVMEQATSDINAIEAKIEEKGVSVNSLTPSSEFPEKIEEVYEKGYEKGKSEFDYDAVFEEGKKAQYDVFWDEVQDYGRRTNYSLGLCGAHWSKQNFKPKYPIRPTASMANCFAYWSNRLFKDLIDLREVCELDTSSVTGANSAFYANSLVYAVGILDFRNAGSIETLFNNCVNLKIVEKIIFGSKHPSYYNMFNNCSSLEEVRFEGEIYLNGLNLQWSTKLSKASWINIVGCYSTTISGLSMTGSLASVNSAFETSEGANDGSTSAEWLNLIATRPNVSFNLV